MTFDEYIAVVNDPNQPMGLYGPIVPVRAYRITGAGQPAPRRAAGRGGDESSRRRFAEHARAAARDQVAAERARFRERLDRHAADALHDCVVARLRRLR